VRTVPSRVATTALPPSIAHSGSFVICLIERRPSGAASKATPSFAWGCFFHLIIFQITLVAPFTEHPAALIFPVRCQLRGLVARPWPLALAERLAHFRCCDPRIAPSAANFQLSISFAPCVWIASHT
jgi:hypothetical protein